MFYLGLHRSWDILNPSIYSVCGFGVPWRTFIQHFFIFVTNPFKNDTRIVYTKVNAWSSEKYVLSLHRLSYYEMLCNDYNALDNMTIQT